MVTRPEIEPLRGMSETRGGEDRPDNAGDRRSLGVNPLTVIGSSKTARESPQAPDLLLHSFVSSSSKPRPAPATDLSCCQPERVDCQIIGKEFGAGRALLRGSQQAERAESPA
eukprot:758602-Hanusia_phi.AAC.5